MVCYDRTIFEILESEGAKNLNIEKSPLNLYKSCINLIYLWLGNLPNIFMEHDFSKEKCIILTHTLYYWLFLQIYLCCL